MHRLETFGRLKLTNGCGERPQPRRRLALLARLASSDARGVSRSELLDLFWPGRDLESATVCLDQLLYETQRGLGASPVCGTAYLRLDESVISCDVVDWNAAIERDDLEAAASLYHGPFMDGFSGTGSAELDRWVETTRARFADAYRQLLEALAARATAQRRVADAVTWWRRLAMEDRIGSRAALGLMQALVDAGDRAGAVDFARIHERIVRVELEIAPDPAVTVFASSLRASETRQQRAPRRPWAVWSARLSSIIGFAGLFRSR